MSNAAKFEVPDSGDNGKAYIYSSGSDSHVLTDVATQAELDAHEADTTSVHGIADTSALLDTADIGVSVQAYDAELTAIAGLTSAADRLPYFTGSGTASLATFTAAGRALIDDADASAQRTTLGLGTIATQAASSVSISGGSITGITDLAVADGGTGASTAADARTNLGLVIGTDVAAQSHTQTASTITDFSEAVDDRVAALLVAGSNVTLTYNDVANTLTVAASGGGGSFSFDNDQAWLAAQMWG